MDNTIIVSLISLLGTLIGSLGGIMVSTKLTNYRLEQLEKKVEKHNNFAGRVPILEEQMKVANHRIDDLERNNNSKLQQKWRKKYGKHKK